VRDVQNMAGGLVCLANQMVVSVAMGHRLRRGYRSM